MSLHGGSVRIIINAPEDRVGKNIFGRVLSDRGGKTLIVRATDSICCGDMQSDLLKLSPVDTNETFYQLEQYYGLKITGRLVADPQDEGVYLFTGVIALD